MKTKSNSYPIKSHDALSVKKRNLPWWAGRYGERFCIALFAFWLVLAYSGFEALAA